MQGCWELDPQDRPTALVSLNQSYEQHTLALDPIGDSLRAGFFSEP
jgi:hypothetical protein